jgi:diacylglycerol kinase family enzyme
VRVLVYQNPNAGHEPESATALITDLQRAGHDASWLNAKEHKLEPSIAGAYDLVIAAGGDGNVGRTARQMIGSLVPIGVLPLGTANNMASVLSSGRDNLVERIAGWRIRPFDAGTVSGADEPREEFFEGVGIGAFAETAATLTELDGVHPPQPGREAELARDIEALRDRSITQPPIECALEAAGRTSTSSIVMLEVLNIGALGPNVWLAPDADPADGLLDVVVVEEARREELTRFLDALVGGHETASPFDVFRTPRMALTPRANAVVHIDGRTVQVDAGTRVELGVLRHAVRFLSGPLA